MSSQIKPVLVKQDVLAGLSDSCAFAVKKGAQNASIQKFTPNSLSPSTQTYTVQVPSLSVVMAREVLWHVKKTYTITGYPTVGTYLVDVGYDSPAPFVNHQDVINTQILINNTSVSMTTAQQLDAILHNCNKQTLAKWSATAPAMLDSYSKYDDVISAGNASFVAGVINNPHNGFEKAYLGEIAPRGCYIESITGNAVGTWNPANAQVVGDFRTVLVTVVSTEPVMCPPFTWGDEENQSQGLYGISNINFTFNTDATGARGFRWANRVDWSTAPATLALVNKQITGVAYNDAQECYLEVRFFTPHPSDLLSEVNVVPCPTFQNFRTPSSFSLQNQLPYSPVGALATQPLVSNNIQLNSIPDKVFIWIKPIDSQLAGGKADACLAINNVSINFNNQSNLMASATPEMLWRLSKEAGSNLSFQEMKGLSPINYPTTDITVASTKGSIVVLDFESIGISEDYYAPGSVGQFNFSVSVRYSNTTGTACVPELNVMFMNSGLFVCQNGTSALYSSGLLSKQQVLDASMTEPILKSHLQRLVGGGFLSNIAGIASKALPFVAPLAKTALSMVPHPVAQGASTVLGALGYGKSGMGVTGAGETGGRRMKNRLL